MPRPVCLVLSAALIVACLARGAVAAEPIRAFILPHSHNDPGWLRTVDQYHTEYVRYILDNIVDELTANPARKFIQVEVSFFSRWYDVQPAAVKDKVKALVSGGQLEFINGGWTMADEAVNTYEAVVDQLTYGHAYLARHFNVTPNIAWHIDPFGASSTFPTMFKDMGYEAFVINRIHYQLKSAWQQSQNLEFMWRGSRSRGQAADMFTHVLDSHYSSPYTFDWEYALPGAINTFDMADTNPPLYAEAVSPETPANLQDRAASFATMVQQRAAYFKTPNVLIPFGNDFKYVISKAVYNSLDLLMEYMNANNATYGMTLEYATLSDYMKAVGASSASTSSWPMFDGDLFPYAFAPAGDRFDQPGYGAQYSYWAGFYTSRPQQKGDIRRVGSALSAAERLLAADPSSLSSAAAATALDRARRATALNTHHDAVTGTSVPLVVQDYQVRLAAAADASGSLSSSALTALTTKPGAEAAKHVVSTNASVLAAACVGDGTTVPVVLYNPTGQNTTQAVRLPMGCDALAATRVQDGKLVAVPAQVDPDVTMSLGPIPLDPRGDPSTPVPPPPPASPKYWLHLLVTIPATGYTTVFVTGKAASTALGAVPRGVLTTSVTPSSSLSLTNGVLTLAFNASTAELSSVSGCGASVSVKQSFNVYDSVTEWPASDAYIFRPMSPATTNVLAPDTAPAVSTVVGPLVQSLVLNYAKHINSSAAVQQVLSLVTDNTTSAACDGKSTTLSPAWFITSRMVLGMLESDHELVTDFQTDLASGYGQTPTNASAALPVMYTDANGLEMRERVKDNPSWVSAISYPQWTQPVAVNYYPTTHAAYIQDAPAGRTPASAAAPAPRRLVAVWDRPHGACSMSVGHLQAMLHRRDAEAAGSLPPLDDVSVLHEEFDLAVGAVASGVTSLIQRTRSEQRTRPVVAAFGSLPGGSAQDPVAAWRAVAQTEGNTLGSALPANVALQSLQCIVETSTPGCSAALLRLRHMYDAGEHPTLSAPVDVVLKDVVPAGSSFVPVTLSGDAVAGSVPVTHVTLGPTETKTFRVEL